MEGSVCKKQICERAAVEHANMKMNPSDVPATAITQELYSSQPLCRFKNSFMYTSITTIKWQQVKNVENYKLSFFTHLLVINTLIVLPIYVV